MYKFFMGFIFFIMSSVGLAGGVIHNNKPIDINHADITTLSQLPSIGKSKAESIVKYRSEHGTFKNIADLSKVKGIGKSIINKILSSKKAKV